MTSAIQPFASPVDFQARIDALWVFPIKSCAGIAVAQAELTPTGLAHDRAWMVVDAEGEMVTQRELPRMALVQPELVSIGSHLTHLVLHTSGMTALQLATAHANTSNPVQVRVWDDRVPAFDMGAAASAWLTECLGDSLGPLRLVRFDDRHRRLSSAKWTPGLQALNQFSDASGNALTWQFKNDGSLTYAVAAVPEPESYALFLAGLGMIGAIARRRRLGK
jgi:uncharacterized protein YcbX